VEAESSLPKNLIKGKMSITSQEQIVGTNNLETVSTIKTEKVYQVGSKEIPSSAKDLFLRLITLAGKSGNESKVAKFIIQYLKSLGIKRVYQDSYGNVVADIPAQKTSDPKYIILSAHMDIVHQAQIIPKIDEEGNIYNGANDILGADDLAGVAIILDTVRKLRHQKIPHNALRLVFTVEEEKHSKGAEKLSPQVYKDVRLAITMDDKDDGRMKFYYKGSLWAHEDQEKNMVVPPPMFSIFYSAGEKVGLKPQIDETTNNDSRIFHLNGQIPSVSLSVGYKYPHTAKETISLRSIEKAQKWLFASLEELASQKGNFPEMNFFPKGKVSIKFENKTYEITYEGRFLTNKVRLKTNGQAIDVLSNRAEAMELLKLLKKYRYCIPAVILTNLGTALHNSIYDYAPIGFASPNYEIKKYSQNGVDVIFKGKASLIPEKERSLIVNNFIKIVEWRKRMEETARNLPKEWTCDDHAYSYFRTSGLKGLEAFVIHEYLSHALWNYMDPSYAKHFKPFQKLLNLYRDMKTKYEAAILLWSKKVVPDNYIGEEPVYSYEDGNFPLGDNSLFGVFTEYKYFKKNEYLPNIHSIGHPMDGPHELFASAATVIILFGSEVVSRMEKLPDEEKKLAKEIYNLVKEVLKEQGII